MIEVPLGWSVKMTYVAPAAPVVLEGRMICAAGAITGAWSNDSYTVPNSTTTWTGFNGLSAGDNTFYATSLAATDAFVQWLTGKSTGADILVCSQGLWNVPFSNQFQIALADLGHNVTSTGTYNFNGYEPLDYDMLCGPQVLNTPSAYHGRTSSADIYDYYLDHGGALLTESGYSNVWTRYGFHGKGYHQAVYGGIHWRGPSPPSSGIGSPGWAYQIPFQLDETVYALVNFGSTAMEATPATKTRPGTTTVLDCSGSGHTSPDEQGVVTLWVNE
jgi:hypothetical protein